MTTSSSLFRQHHLILAPILYIWCSVTSLQQAVNFTGYADALSTVSILSKIYRTSHHRHGCHHCHNRKGITLQGWCQPFLIGVIRQQSRPSALHPVRSISASAAYLDSLSHQLPLSDQSLLGATARYLDTVSATVPHLFSTIDQQHPANSWYNHYYYPSMASSSSFMSDQMMTDVQQATDEFIANMIFTSDTDPVMEGIFTQQQQQLVTDVVAATSTVAGGTVVPSLWDMDIADTDGRIVDNNGCFFSDSSSNSMWKVPMAGTTNDQYVGNIHNGNNGHRSDQLVVEPTTDETFKDLTVRLQNMATQFTDSITSSLGSTNNIVSKQQQQQQHQQQESIQDPMIASSTTTTRSSMAAGMAATTTMATKSSGPTIVSKRTTIAKSTITAPMTAAAAAATTTIPKTAAATAAIPKTAAGATVTKTAVAATATTATFSATALAGQQGFDDSWFGVIELVIATILSVPRTILDEARENIPAMDNTMDAVRNDLLVPLISPLYDITSQTPLEQAKSVLKVLQLLLAVVVAVPRAIIEGLTGMSMAEFQTALNDIDLKYITDQFLLFCRIASFVVVTIIKTMIGVGIMIGTGIGTFPASSSSSTATGNPEEVLLRTTTFVVEDLIPAIVDGFVLLLQQFVNLLLEGGAAVLATL